MKTTLRNLRNADACKVFRKFSVNLEVPKTALVQKAQITRQCVYACFDKQLDINDFPSLVNWLDLSFQNDNVFDNNETCKKVAQRTANEVGRLVSSVHQTPIARLQMEDIDLGHDLIVTTVPDLMFHFKDGNREIVRSVILKTGRPTRTQKSIDNGTDNSLDLYALIKYNRLFIDRSITNGNEITNEAMIWYLRRVDDRASGYNANFAANFFEPRGGNVIGMSELYTAQGPNANLIDKMIEPQVLSFIDGKECSEEDCEYCDIRRICEYKKPDIPVPTDPVVKNFKTYKLNKEQQQIVSAPFNGIYRVIAKAGTGKTTTVSFRNAWMYTHGIDPKSVLNITFTVLAAGETTERILAICKSFGLTLKAEDINSMTIDGLLYKIISENYADFGFTAVPEVYDNESNRLVIKKLLDEHIIQGLDYARLNMDERFVKGGIAVANKIFSLMRNYSISNLQTMKQYLGDFWYRFVAGDQTIQDIMDLYPLYVSTLKAKNLITYDDFRTLMDAKLAKDPTFLNSLGYEHIIVDEFQDTSPWQVNFVKKLTETPCWKELMVVGDDAQSIYGFRGTSPYGILHLDKILNKPVTDMFLQTNYRSVPEVLTLADRIHANDRDKINTVFIPARASEGITPSVHGFFTEYEEYDSIMMHVHSLLDQGVEPSDIAILAATSNELLKLKKMLDKDNIQNVLLNPENMIDNPRVQAAISFVRAITIPDDTKDLLVYANAKRFGGLLQVSSLEQQSSIEMARFDVDNINSLFGEDKKKAIFEALKLLDMQDEIYEAFLQKIASMNLSDMIEYVLNFEEYGQDNAARKNKTYLGVVLTTAHSSKGLEFKHVILTITKFDTKDLHKDAAAALENAKQTNTLTSYNSPLEERNRLLYVAVTRAKDSLFVVGQWVAFGSKTQGYTLNRYLKETYAALNVPYPEASIMTALLGTKKKN